MNNKPVFASEGKIEDLYPEVESLNLVVKELLNLGWKKPENIYSISKNNLRTYFECTNPVCLGGGASITNILSQAIMNKETKISTGEHCGHNESGGRPCLHYFRVEGEISYK